MTLFFRWGCDQRGYAPGPPIRMLTEYIAKQMARAKYKVLPDGTYFGDIPGLRGVWANADNLEGCRTELQEVLEGWLLLKIKDGDPIPGFRIKINPRPLLKRA